MLLVLGLCILFSAAVYAQDRADALVEYRNGNFDRAIQICLNEIEQMPRNMDSYTVLGWSYLKKGDYQNALDAGNRALQVSRHDARIIEIVAEANYYLGKNLESLKYFEEYTVIAPTGDRIELAYFFMGGNIHQARRI